MGINLKILNPFTSFNQSVKNAAEKGVEKWVSWSLFSVLHLFPGIYIREFTAEAKWRTRVEQYVLFKLTVTILAFGFCWYDHYLMRGLLIYFGLETILYNLFFIICSNLYPPARSYKRALILGFINYVEIVFNFASLYAGSKLIAKASDAKAVLDKIDYVYFSIGTGGALDYGDYLAVDNTGKYLSILQCIVFLMFFILFITYNASMFIEGRNNENNQTIKSE